MCRTVFRSTIVGAFVLFGSVPAPVAPSGHETKIAPQLARFDAFVGKTWRALVDAENEVYDVSRWERALNGQAIRVLHSVGDGAYGGETIVMWDREREQLIYTYFTTAGFYTTGSMYFDDEGRLHSREQVTGNEDGVTEVRAIMELPSEGEMRVRTRMLRNGEWEDRGEVVYRVAPDAEVILD